MLDGYIVEISKKTLCRNERSAINVEAVCSARESTLQNHRGTA
jgi:hypothetical protein